MSDTKNNNTKPASVPEKRSLDPSSVVQGPKPQTQPNQGGGNQQSTGTTSSEGESKSNG